MGERATAMYLQKSGYTILNTNLYSRFGEIDIIASKDGITHIIEVKTRTSARYGMASQALSRKKVINMMRTVAALREGLHICGRVQFDLAAVQIDGNTATIQLFQNIGLGDL